MELGGVFVTGPNTKYSYPAVLENLLNYNKLIADTRLLGVSWKKDMATHFQVTNPAGENTGLPARTAWFARRRLVTLIGRPHVELFQQEKLIPANSAYLLKTVATDHDHPQVNYKI